MLPFLVLAAGVAFVVAAVIRFRVHPFLALMGAAFIVGALTPGTSAIQAIDRSVEEFGHTAAAIAIVIVAATIIGKCLMDSGAADVITRRLLRWVGEKRAPLALLGSGYLLSIPVFFDTVFYLLVPLAKAFRLRTGGHYAFYVLAICAGAGLTHALVAPTPGPLIMATNLKLNLGTTIIAGLAFSLLPAILVGYFWIRRQSSRLTIPLRETPDLKLDELEAQTRKPDSELPPFWLAVLPIVLPVVMIAASSVAATLNESAGPTAAWASFFEFVGNRNIAMLAAAAVAVVILLRQRKERIGEIMRSMETAVASAGVIILITAAGGAFGAMIRHAGVGDVVQQYAAGGTSGVLLLFLAFGIAALMKTAQGSSTVAMITGSAIMTGVIDGVALPYHPVYIFLAVGFGSMVVSWMNDSGFWVIGRMSGFTEAETLKTWTVMCGLMGVVGFVQILLASLVLPLDFLP